MLRKESVSESLWNLLIDLQSREILKDYFLVGGTALALQLGHRKSIDIDLFTRKDINKDEIHDLLNSEFKGRYQIHNEKRIIFQIIIDNIKVDLVKNDYDFIEEIKHEDGIRYLGKKDISAMKLLAVAQRGDQAKDFVDVYYLLKEIPLNDMFEYYKKKYTQTDICMIKRSLIYFDDVTDNTWAAVELLSGKLSVKDVKQTIVDAVNRYHKEMGGIAE